MPRTKVAVPGGREEEEENGPSEKGTAKGRKLHTERETPREYYKIYMSSVWWGGDLEGLRSKRREGVEGA